MDQSRCGPLPYQGDLQKFSDEAVLYFPSAIVIDPKRQVQQSKMSEVDEAFVDRVLGAIAAPARPLTYGNEETFEHWCRAALPKIYAFFQSQVRNRHTAQDLVSHTFLKACHHRGSVPDGPNAMLWLFRVAHNALIDHWRVQGRRAGSTLSLDELADPPVNADNPESAYAMKEQQIALLRTMAGLSEADRALLALKFAGQRTNREIAAILHLSEGAVSMRLLRALQRLRTRLEEAGAA
jgi:RNA polymerase sigma-70 factor (ECF subfamily)